MSKQNVVNKTTSHKSAYLVMLLAGAAALIAAFVLSLEKLHLLQHPDATLSCSINLVLNCSTVMESWQSSVFFGIPNMYIGLMTFPVVVTVAVAGLSSVRFPRPFLVAAHIGYALGTIFAYWLLFQSMYVIQVLCPWCLVVTLSCTLLFAAMTTIALRDNIYHFPDRVNQKIQSFVAGGYHKLVVASWVVLMIVLVYLQFGADLFL